MRNPPLQTDQWKQQRFHAGKARTSSRKGKIVVLVAIALPALLGMVGLVIDGGMLLSADRHLQSIADIAATAAATEKKSGKSDSEALAAAQLYVHSLNSAADAVVEMRSPPWSGPYSASSQHVEVVLTSQIKTYFIHLLSGSNLCEIRARAVAGVESVTSGAAIVVLDPNPGAFDAVSLPLVTGIPSLPSLPAIAGGFETLGIGNARVNGAVLINTEWGGVDENGDPIGEETGLLGISHAMTSNPIIGLTKLLARDIRVVGGVDNAANYGAFHSSNPSPLRAGMLPAPDPLKNLPVPSMQSDADNIRTDEYGGMQIVGLPLLSPPVTLMPGVYEWIEITSGRVQFLPGIYVIRGKNPVTGLSLSVLAGQVQAAGVLFYITDSASYSATTGLPDVADDSRSPNASSVPGMLPSVSINLGLLGSRFSGLEDPSSPFHGLFIYQRRNDRRPIVLVQENLLGTGQLRGAIYAKWGHVLLAGRGTFDARVVAGTMRLLVLADLSIEPTTLFPPAQDVFLVE